MTEATIIALLASLPTTIAAVGAFIGAIGAFVVTIRSAVRVKQTSEKADTILIKTAEIHTLTNGQLTKVTAALETANAKIGGLEKVISQLVIRQEEKPKGGF